MSFSAVFIERLKRGEVERRDLGRVSLGLAMDPKIMTAALEPAAGKRVELEDAFGAYTGACEAEGKRALPPGLFVDPLRKFCKAAGIRIKDEGGQVYLMNVRLADNPSRVHHEAEAR
jgi:hypothetical protein